MTAATAAAHVPAAPNALLEAAREIAGKADVQAEITERERALPADLVRDMRACRLFAMALPAALGGLEADPATIVSVVAEIARADASAGWNILIGNSAAFLAWLSPDAAEDIVRLTPDPVVAGSMAPLGTAEQRADGAYRLTGQWPFASGCGHADWLMGGFVVTENGRPRHTPSGRPELRVAFFPVSAATVLETWHVAGLRGTGSHDIRVDCVDVPAARTAVPFLFPAQQPGPLFRLSPFNILMVLLAGFPLGVARRALDELTALAAVKRRAGAAPRLLDSAVVQTEIVAAEAALHAAREGVLAVFRDTWAALAAGTELTLTQRAWVAAATVHAFDVGRHITTTMFHFAGASALYHDHPLQRCFRDAHAACQHIAFGDESRLRIARALMGQQSEPTLFQV
jgi:alkylation response protein AidB-like acyl-CoA dehydrogenase